LDKEEIRSILEDYYPNIKELLGEIVEERLKSPNYEESILISRLLRASRRLPLLKKEEELEKKELEAKYFEDDDYEDEVEYFGDYDYEDDYVKPARSFRLDSGLHVLDNAIAYGKKYCGDFNYIFQNINLSKPQEADNRIAEILVQVKAFEFLSKSHFREITVASNKQNRAQVDFTGIMHKVLYAIVVTRLFSAKQIEERFAEYGTRYIINALKNDIIHAIDQTYPRLENIYRTRFGVAKGIIFISSGRDYFGQRDYENSLYGLPPSKLGGVLNRVWTSRKESYKHLHHIVITTGRNVNNALVYPPQNWECIS
jgi:hypothetical protein